MIAKEFLNEFDVLYNNIMSNSAPGLNSYEISVFLTQAQEQLIKSFYNGNLGAYELTEEMRRYLSELNITSNSLTSIPIEGHNVLTQYSYLFQMPNDVWFITYEQITLDDQKLGCKYNNQIQVIPATRDDLHKLMNNPFKGPSERRVLRIDSSSNIIELISKYNIKDYVIGYLKKPTPIIVDDLTQYDTTIEGLSAVTDCSLNPVLHRNILQLAVQLAKEAYIGK